MANILERVLLRHVVRAQLYSVPYQMHIGFCWHLVHTPCFTYCSLLGVQGNHYHFDYLPNSHSLSMNLALNSNLGVGSSPIPIHVYFVALVSHDGFNSYWLMRDYVLHMPAELGTVTIPTQYWWATCSMHLRRSGSSK